MRRLFIRISVAATLGAMLSAGLSLAQDFQKSYSIPAGGIIRVGNVSGDVKIIGHSDGRILVTAFKEGRDRDLLQIEDKSDADHVMLGVHYPERGNCNASVNFEVRVPGSTNYSFQISSVSGNLSASNVTGQIRAETVSGNVDVTDVTGLLSANSVSGDVNAQLARVQGTGDMKFATVSGNVIVRAPENLDADVDMSTLSGSLKAEFPIQVQEKRYGPGRSARGRLGAGSRNLRITSISGRVSLIRG